MHRSPRRILLGVLVPATAAGILVLAQVRLLGQRAGLYGTGVGLTLMVVGSVVILGVLSWGVARALDRAHDQARASGEQILALNGELEDRVRARTAELEAGEQRFRSLTATAFDAIVSADDQGRIVYANPAAEMMFGWAPGELTGCPLTVLMPERYRHRHLQGIAHVAGGGPPGVLGSVIEIEGRRRDGAEFPLEMTLSMWPHAGHRMFGAILRDVSERKRSEAARHRQVVHGALLAAAVQAVAQAADLDEAFRAFDAVLGAEHGFDRASFAVHIQGSRFQVIATSGAGAWRLPVGSVVGVEGEDRRRRYHGGLPVLVADTAYREANGEGSTEQELLRAGIRCSLSVPILCAGEVQALINFASPRPNAITADSVETLTAIVRATSATFNMLLLRDREQEALTRLRELDAMKNEFVATVAHDLRSPMTVITGFAELLQNAPADMTPDQRAMLLDRIVANVRRLSDLVRDVLDVTRIESGEFAYHLEPFDLVELARHTLAEIASTQPSRVCRLDQPSGPLPSGFGDRDQCWRVITNLLSNAVKFSPDASAVTMTVQADGPLLRVGIHNEGRGIDPADLPRLFQRFSRLTPADGEPRIPGTGLGLYICRQIIEAHGGRIWAHSTPGDGTTFSFTIPVATPPIPSPRRTIGGRAAPHSAIAA